MFHFYFLSRDTVDLHTRSTCRPIQRSQKNTPEVALGVIGRLRHTCLRILSPATSGTPEEMENDDDETRFAHGLTEFRIELISDQPLTPLQAVPGQAGGGSFL